MGHRTLFYRRMASPLHATRASVGALWATSLVAATLLLYHPLALLALLAAVVLAAGRAGVGWLVPRALSLGQALGVGGEHRQHARCQRGGQRRSERQPAERPQQLVGIDREPGEGGDHDQQGQLQGDHRAVHERLQRQVPLAERPQVSNPREHGKALPGYEHVHRHDRQRDDQGGAQRARDEPSHPGAAGRQEHSRQQR